MKKRTPQQQEVFVKMAYFSAGDGERAITNLIDDHKEGIPTAKAVAAEIELFIWHGMDDEVDAIY